MRWYEIALLAAVSGVCAYFAGGFVAGVMWCEAGNSLLGNTLGRLFIGVLIGFLSAFTGGFPPANEGGVGPPLNTWPYILGCWAVFFPAFFATVVWWRSRCHETETSGN